MQTSDLKKKTQEKYNWDAMDTFTH
jgi:hypothetical protein